MFVDYKLRMLVASLLSIPRPALCWKFEIVVDIRRACSFQFGYLQRSLYMDDTRDHMIHGHMTRTFQNGRLYSACTPTLYLGPSGWSQAQEFQTTGRADERRVIEFGLSQEASGRTWLQ